MRTVGVVTVGRSDYGIYRPVLRRILADPALKLHLYATGMHLSSAFGHTVDEIEAESIPVAERIPMLEDADTPEAIARSMGRGVMGFAEAFGRFRPDLLVVLGDRFEMVTAAMAALPFNLPVAHIHGGEVTEGAIDECLRHSLTKLSHLHFASTEDHARRIRQLGEEPWRVHVSGAPSLDNLTGMEFLDRPALEKRVGLDLSTPPVLVTFHPVTTEYERTAHQVRALLDALESTHHPLVFTLPNADTAGRTIITAVEAFVAAHPRAVLVDSLGTLTYFSLMRCAAAMVGNSSSALLEAASFGLPALNVGNRQKGRTRGMNVIDVPAEREAIREGLKRTLDPEFRISLAASLNPYSATRPAADVIVEALRDVPLERLVPKAFRDLSLHEEAP